jgi:hypothetical protein
VAVLLISRHFLTSKFIAGQEVPPLLQRRQAQGVRVIPLIISPCQWQRIDWLKAIQGRPRDGKPLSGMSQHDADLVLSNLAGEIADLAPSAAIPTQPTAEMPPRIGFFHFPAGAEHFFGREEELAVLDAAWADSQHSHVVEWVAPGGVGKSSLVKRWLENVQRDGWRGARQVYVWSFYSQGASHDRQASDDDFLSAALAWFGVELDPAPPPGTRGSAWPRLWPPRARSWCWTASSRCNIHPARWPASCARRASRRCWSAWPVWVNPAYAWSPAGRS